MRNCRICNSLSDNQPVINVKEMMFSTGAVYPYFQCPSCGCVQITEFEKNPEMTYPSGYYSFKTFGNSNILDFLKKQIIRYSVLRSLGPGSLPARLLYSKQRDMGAHALKGIISKQHRILDIGSGDGALIMALYKLGYKQVTGIDPYLVNEVLYGTFRLMRKSLFEMDSKEKFDVIMMHHSFEHVENPHEVFEKIHQLLSDGGVCVIRIPVADSYAFEQYGSDWVQLDSPRHNFLHTNMSMELLAHKHGFGLREIQNDSTEFQFLGSEQYKQGIGLNNPRSYFVPFYKKFSFNKKHIFKNSQVKEFRRKAKELNIAGRGDQRAYFLVKEKL